MNAIQFIKEHGVEKARKVIDGAPYLNSEETHFCAEVFVYTDGFDDDGYCQHCVDISDLKRLVESADLVNLKGGVKKLKKEADCLFHNEVEGIALRYEQAIADYELLFCSGESK